MRYLEQRNELFEGLQNNRASSEERVSITLNEYLHILDEYAHLKDEVERLESRVREANQRFASIGIPEEVIGKIIPESAQMTVEDASPLDFTKRYNITFKTRNY